MKHEMNSSFNRTMRLQPATIVLRTSDKLCRNAAVVDGTFRVPVVRLLIIQPTHLRRRGPFSSRQFPNPNSPDGTATASPILLMKPVRSQSKRLLRQLALEVKTRSDAARALKALRKRMPGLSKNEPSARIRLHD